MFHYVARVEHLRRHRHAEQVEAVFDRGEARLRYATGGRVVHSYTDHVPILKFIERNWSLKLSTAETKCAKWRRESVPIELREKGREALASCLTDLVFGVVVSIAGCFRGRRVTGSALSLLGCREPEAFTVHLQDMDMMGEAIEQRAREPLRS